MCGGVKGEIYRIFISEYGTFISFKLHNNPIEYILNVHLTDVETEAQRG